MYLSNNSVTNNSKIIFLSLIFLSGCGGGGSSSDSPLTQSIVEPINSSSWNLDKAFEYGMADGTYTQQITVIENGELLRTEFRDIGNIEANQLTQSGRGELVSQYQGIRSNSPVTSWSTAKSFTGILIGIAQDQNLLNIDDKASVYLNEWLDDDRKDITIRNILNMRSGLELPGGVAGGNITIFNDQASICIALPLVMPIGEQFEYNNCNSMLLGVILERATGQDFKVFADTYLFSKLNIDARWWRDPSGNYLSYCCLDMTQAEFGRFGSMILNKGDGIVSEAFINDILATNSFYNLQFWFGDNTLETRGYDGQIIAIDFDNQLIVLRNSLYFPKTEGEYYFVNDGSDDPTNLEIPLTLPQVVMQLQENFDMNIFLDILKSNN
jgi:CubicO group peptidase (beta-lactamase class C family)